MPCTKPKLTVWLVILHTTRESHQWNRLTSSTYFRFHDFTSITVKLPHQWRVASECLWSGQLLRLEHSPITTSSSETSQFNINTFRVTGTIALTWKWEHHSRRSFRPQIELQCSWLWKIPLWKRSCRWKGLKIFHPLIHDPQHPYWAKTPYLGLETTLQTSRDSENPLFGRLFLLSEATSQWLWQL